MLRRQRELFVSSLDLSKSARRRSRLGEVVVAQADLDLELRVLLRERAHPLLDLTAAVLVARAVLQVARAAW